MEFLHVRNALWFNILCTGVHIILFMGYSHEYQDAVFGPHCVVWCRVVLDALLSVATLSSVSVTSTVNAVDASPCPCLSLWLAVSIHRSRAGFGPYAFLDRWMCIRGERRACDRRDLYLVFVMLRCGNANQSTTVSPLSNSKFFN